MSTKKILLGVLCLLLCGSISAQQKPACVFGNNEKAIIEKAMELLVDSLVNDGLADFSICWNELLSVSKDDYTIRKLREKGLFSMKIDTLAKVGCFEQELLHYRLKIPEYSRRRRIIAQKQYVLLATNPEIQTLDENYINAYKDAAALLILGDSIQQLGILTKECENLLNILVEPEYLTPEIMEIVWQKFWNSYLAPDKLADAKVAFMKKVMHSSKRPDCTISLEVNNIHDLVEVATIYWNCVNSDKNDYTNKKKK